ncbi:MAG: hypothetical protein U9O20_02615 [Patescibacteria group bacterium]|nr:hypothetical protein [Patescibacteria group bacterium]
MRRRSKVLIVVLVTLVVVNLGVFVCFLMQNKERDVQTAIIAQQQKEENKERQKKQAEKREIEDIKKGLDKTIGGKIESIDLDRKNFVVDLDVFGNHKRYTIYVDEGTELKMTYIDSRIVKPNEEGLESSEQVTEKIFDIEFDELKVGVDAHIKFAKRLDIDKEDILTATKVNAIYYKIIE